MKEALKFLNKPLTIRWYLLDSRYTTQVPIALHQNTSQFYYFDPSRG